MANLIPKIAKGAVGFLIIYLMVAQDIFGIDALLRQNSQFLASRFLSFFYRQGEHTSLIVLFDDNYLEHALIDNDKIDQTRHWPAPFDDHAAVLRSILRQEPSIVFYDIFFRPRDDNGKVEVFLDYFKEADEKKIPIIMGYHPGGTLNDQVYGELENNRYAAASWSGYGDFMPRYCTYGQLSCENVEQLHARYHDYLGQPKETTPPLLPAVAFRLYEELLKKTSDESHSPQQLENYYYAEFNNPLFVYWAAHIKEPSPPFQGIKKIYIRIKLALAHIFDSRSLFNREGKYGEYADTFTSIPVISVRDLFDPKQQENLSELIKGKAIFIGTNISGLPDKVTSPIEGILPGVFFHAMAYDNLVRYKNEYKVDGEARESFGFSSADFFEFLILIVMLLCFWLFKIFEERRWPRNPTKDDDEIVTLAKFGYEPKIAAKRFLFYSLVAALSYTIYGCLLYYTWNDLHWDPGNFLGMLSISIPLYTVLRALVEFLFSLLYAPFRKSIGLSGSS